MQRLLFLLVYMKNMTVGSECSVLMYDKLFINKNSFRGWMSEGTINVQCTITTLWFLLIFSLSFSIIVSVVDSFSYPPYEEYQQNMVHMIE